MSYAPSEDDTDLYTLVNEGLALYGAGKPYEAHELWEYAWGAEVGRTKQVLQVMIQIAAALHKHRTGNPRGTSKLLAKAKDNLANASTGASAWLGIDLVLLAAEVDRALAEADAVAAGTATDVVAPRLPRVVGPDGIIYLHGVASGPSSAKSRLIVPPLVAAGHSVVVPDLNEGDFEHLTVTRALARVRRLMRDRTIIIGSSLGGYLAALAAAKDERVKGLVLLAPAFDFAPRMRARFPADVLATWQRLGRTFVEHYALGGLHAIGYELLADAERHAPRPPLRVPTYILHGRRDDTVPASTSEEVAKQWAAVVELDLVDDDHSLVASAPRALAAAERLTAKLGLQPEPAVPDVAPILAKLAALDTERDGA